MGRWRRWLGDQVTRCPAPSAANGRPSTPAIDPPWLRLRCACAHGPAAGELGPRRLLACTASATPPGAHPPRLNACTLRGKYQLDLDKAIHRCMRILKIRKRRPRPKISTLKGCHCSSCLTKINLERNILLIW